MINNNLYIPNKKRTYKKVLQLFTFIFIILVLYHLLRFALNSNHQISYASFFGYITVVVWITLIEKNVRKIKFDDQEEKLTVTKQSIFGKKENLEIKYSELDYKVKNYNNFWSLFFGSKRLTILKNNTEIIKLASDEEFNEKEILEIAGNLNSIRNASS